MIRVGAEPFDPAAELAAFIARVRGTGAVVSFVGLVRSETDGNDVTGLELDHYRGFTEKAVAEIGADASARFGLSGLAIVHRYGTVAAGEPIVFVATAAAHRRAAFDAADYMMDRLKTEAPFWKRELEPDGARWIEARASDLEDRARWG